MKKLLLPEGLLICSVLLLSSCQPQDTYHPVLRQAELLMHEYPDSAFILLQDSVDSSGLSGKNQADWCLLLTQARNKCNKPHTSDSLIRIACEYYEANPNPERLMLAYYSMGRVNHELKDTLQAQNYYSKALDTGIEALNDHQQVTREAETYKHRHIITQRHYYTTLFILLLLTAFFIASFFYRRKNKRTTTEEIKQDSDQKELLFKQFKRSPLYLKFCSQRNEDEARLLTKEEWNEFMENIDRIFPQFHIQINRINPPLSPVLLEMCYLIKADIKPVTQTYLLRQSHTYLSQNRKRLYERYTKNKGSSDGFIKFIKDI